MSIALFIRLFIIVHATAGTIALLAGPVAMLTKKGGPRHRRAGRYYTYSMAVVFVTAVVVAYLKSLSFLFMIAFFSFYLVLSGYRALRWKRLAIDGKVSSLDWGIQIGAGITALVLLGWGVGQLIGQNFFGSVGIVFGGIALVRVKQTIDRFRTPPEDKAYWLYSHIIGMSAGYVATLTAFLVVNVHFLPPIVVWLIPTVIGVPLIVRVVRRIRAANEQKAENAVMNSAQAVTVTAN
ncbi:DUF2306 domain-containing protein [Spirosoma agri]|uniref:DUF2306 domain-containing protein n=1 Tax=Spirosoma agri TaxID=1987381 RepID=A0A6M0IP90_9BACT|nr:DUF2306 domain-containing protein [Spirosoma agri]NEU69752.1 DUF2306 domain-containing protein [Spirosoma agri]